jgi:hypothetical protein
MKLILAVLVAGPLGFFARSARQGLVLYLLAWAVVFPAQTVVVFSEGDGDLSYWLVNALILAGGVGLNRVARILCERRRAHRASTSGYSCPRVVGLAALALTGAPGAHAGVALNTIDKQATSEQDGAQVRASGPDRLHARRTKHDPGQCAPGGDGSADTRDLDGALHGRGAAGRRAAVPPLAVPLFLMPSPLPRPGRVAWQPRGRDALRSSPLLRC